MPTTDATRPASPTRRRVLAAGAAAASLPLVAPLARGAGASSPPRRVLRFAHLTDTHVQQDKGAAEGMAACLRHAQRQADPPAFILFGGDNVMNVDGDGGEDRAPGQLATWNAVIKNELSLPSRYAIGNHDTLLMDPVGGKRWAMDAFGLDSRYYAFDRDGWRFIVLDSTSPNSLRGGGGGYKGLLDEEQFDWLARTLRDTPDATPVCVVSHIPIIAACAYFDGDNEKSGDWRVPGAWMHVDARRIKDLFHAQRTEAGTPKVRLCLSGHIHLADRLEYLGTTHACNGAVSGGWWGGPYQEFQPAYAMVDLYDDGTSDVDLIAYGWKARP